MNHLNFIIRNYLMGELAGGDRGTRRGVPRGRGFLDSQPRLCSLLATHFYSRMVCFQDVCPERGCLLEASVRLKGIT